MPESSTPKTAISGYDRDTISVRGKDLVHDLMGRLSFTEMIVFQLLGQEATPAQRMILDAVMVTIMEHGLVPSTVVTRLTHAGAPESFQGAVVAGLLGVGDRYAGTASQCAQLLDRITDVPKAEQAAVAAAIVDEHRAAKHPLPGFGHPVHKAGDPRTLRLIEIAREAGAGGAYIAALDLLAQSLAERLGKAIPTNISAGIAAALREAGIPARAMRGVIMTARCAGLAGHLVEEMDNPVADAMWHAAEETVTYTP